MRKKARRLFFPVWFTRVFFTTSLFLVIMLSCKTSHSVKDMRAARDPYAGYTPPSVKVKEPKTKEDALVKDLFMQSKRPAIELPFVEGADNVGPKVVSEKVTYTNAEIITKTTSEANKVVNLNEVQQLNEVVVTAKSRFTPEQNGRVSIDFVLRVPKELLSTNFRVALAPKVLHNDSIVQLQAVYLKGNEFGARQKQAYKDYEDFENSIVSKSHYDSVFVDHDGVRQDIENQQKFYYEQYHKEWSRQTDFEDWKTKKDKAEALQEASKAGYDKKIYHENVRKAREQAMKEVARGKDTTGFFARYMKRFIKPADLEKSTLKVEQKTDYRLDFYQEYSKKARERVISDWANGKDTTGAYVRYMKGFDKNFKTIVLDGEDIGGIPTRFKDLYKSGRSMEQIINQSFTEEDSLQIAQSRYKFEDIAFNEMKDAMREEKRRELILFPYEEDVRLDTVIQTDRDFIYHYKQDYPVSPGLRSLRLILNTQIDAIDRSRFVQPLSDTISYFISSLSQLADTSLITKRTTVHRDMYNSMVVYPKFLPGKFTFNIAYKDNKAETDKVINTYRTFTDEGKLIMDSVIIRVSTSLDGDYDKNYEVTKKRANTLKEYLVKALGGSADVDMVFKTRHSGEDWNTLANLLTRRTDLQNKDDILNMLREAVYPDQTEENIKKTYPRDYAIIRDSIYPLLNKAEVVFNMTRPGMIEEVVVNTEVRPDYQKALGLLQDRKYWDALEILSNYPDYNTALCLVCMGYNAKALELLESLPQTGNNEYLLAILAIRSGDDSQARVHLLKACELDSSKIYRVPLDPEVAGFVRKYRLQGQLDQKSSYVVDELNQ
ncbi:MAG: tetratricopeptide repeat protein [Dysgonomonas sp.]